MPRVKDFSIAPFQGSKSKVVKSTGSPIRTSIVSVAQTAYNKGVLSRRKGRKR